MTVDRMSLSHSKYISNLLKKFGMESCKPISTPLAERLILSKDDSLLVGSDEEKQMRQLDYRGLPDRTFLCPSFSVIPSHCRSGSLTSSKEGVSLPQKDSRCGTQVLQRIRSTSDRLLIQEWGWLLLQPWESCNLMVFE